MKQNKWSTFIRKRDGRRCRICNAKDELTAHHLYSQSKYPQWKRHKSNGITLCQSCHAQYHMERQESNPHQFVDWCFRKMLNNEITASELRKIFNVCRHVPSPAELS